MNLRTHTFVIPFLCGVGSFSLLVASDYGMRRLAHGEGYGVTAYLADIQDRPAHGPSIRVISNHQVIEIDRRHAAPKALSMAVAKEPDVPLAGMGDLAPPPVSRQAAAMPQSPLLAAADVAAPDLAMAAAAPRVVLNCTSDHGFKRCRFGN